MDDDDVVEAALLTPAFREDLSTWSLSISRDGVLVQEVFQWRSGSDRKEIVRLETAQVPPEEVAEILALARRLGFDGFQDRYDDYFCTDQDTRSITVRFRDKVKRVEVYGADSRGCPTMIGFVALWNLIHLRAPFNLP